MRGIDGRSVREAEKRRMGASWKVKGKKVANR